MELETLQHQSIYYCRKIELHSLLDMMVEPTVYDS